VRNLTAFLEFKNVKFFSIIDVSEFCALCSDFQDEAMKCTEEVDVSVKEIVSFEAQNGPVGDVSLI
jgi:hypothetical protein